MQQINAIILIICYYVTIALGLPTFNPNAQTTSRKNQAFQDGFEVSVIAKALADPSVAICTSLFAKCQKEARERTRFG